MRFWAALLLAGLLSASLVHGQVIVRPPGDGGGTGGAAAGFSVITDTVDPDTEVDCTIGIADLGWFWNNVDTELPNVRRWQCLENVVGEKRWQFLSSSWQETYEQGEHGLVDVPSARVELFQPEKSLGGSKIERWGDSLGIARRGTDASGGPMAPDPVVIWFDSAFDIYTEVDDDPSTTKRVVSIENVAGVTTLSFLDESENVVLRWPTVGNGLVIRDERERSTVLEEVAAVDDNMPFGDFLKASTIQSVWCRCSDVTGTLPTFTLSDGSGNAMTITDTNPVCTAYSAARSAKAVTAGNSLTAGEMLLFHTTNTPTAGKTCQISVSYTLD